MKTNSVTALAGVVSPAVSGCRTPRQTLFAAAAFAVFFGLSQSAVADYDDYLETFESWPDSTMDTGCGERGSRPGGCNGSFIFENGGTVTVAGFGEDVCFSGERCWRGRFSNDESQASFAPKGMSSPSSTEVYVRYYAKYQVPTEQCSSGLASGHKQGRVFREDLSLQLSVCSFLLEVPALGLRKCQLDSFRVDDFYDQWIKVEWWMKVDGGNAQCEITATEPNGTVHSVTDSWNGQGNFGPDMWIMGNKGNAGTYTIYLDDICIGNSRNDRNGFCAEVAPGRPNNNRVID